MSSEFIFKPEWSMTLPPLTDAERVALQKVKALGATASTPLGVFRIEGNRRPCGRGA